MASALCYARHFPEFASFCSRENFPGFVFQEKECFNEEQSRGEQL